MCSENLSGFWAGTYWYDEIGEPIVPFLAIIDDVAGKLSGNISEPNTIGYSSRELKAHIYGTRDSSSLAFAKVYDGASDSAHRVDYTGLLSPDGTCITGYWLLENYSGGFRMNRTLLPHEESESLTADLNEPVVGTQL